MTTRQLHFYSFLFLLLFQGCQSMKKDKTKIENPRFIKTTYEQSQFIENKSYTVFLPKSYSKDLDKNYPVLFIMDGQNLFIDSLAYGGFSWRVDQVVDSLVEKNTMHEIIIVGVEHAGIKRFSEYMPQHPLSKLPQARQDSLRNVFSHPVYSDDFLKFLTKELKPTIDKNYRTKTEAANTFIGGSSMGGLISMYALCEYPNIFGGAMCLSSHWIVGYDDSASDASEALLNYFSIDIAKGKKWYFDFGTKGLDQYYEPWQNRIDEILQKNGYAKNKDWITRKYEGHDHNERFWNSRLHIPLVFLFGK